MIQSAVLELRALFPFPSSDIDELDQKKIDLIGVLENTIPKISRPISDGDAIILLECFGPDDCFGLFWALVHLIETAPSWPMLDVLKGMDGFCIDVMKSRCRNSGYRI